MKTMLQNLNNQLARLLQQTINNRNTAATMRHLQTVPAYRTTTAAEKAISIINNSR
jgi:hypothetical protein